MTKRTRAPRKPLPPVAPRPPKTAAERYHDAVEEHAYALRSLESERASAQATIAEFAEKVQKDPAYQLSWGGAAFKAGASVKVLGLVLHHLGEGLPAATLLKHALREALRGARHSTSRSTSCTSNLAEDCETEVWADLADDGFGRRSLQWLAHIESEIASAAFLVEAEQTQHLIDALAAIPRPL